MARPEQRAGPDEIAWHAVGDRLLAGLAHSLRSSLTTLFGTADVLEFEAGSRRDANVCALRYELERLEQLVALVDLLPRRSAAAPEPLSLRETLESIVALHGLEPAAESVPVALEWDPAVPAVLADPGVLTPALLLSLDIVVRAVGDGGRVAIRLTGAADRVTLVIEGQAPREGRAWAGALMGAPGSDDLRVLGALQRRLAPADIDLVRVQRAGAPRLEISLPAVPPVGED